MQGMNCNSLKPSMVDSRHIPPVCMRVYTRAPGVKKERSGGWTCETASTPLLLICKLMIGSLCEYLCVRQTKTQIDKHTSQQGTPRKTNTQMTNSWNWLYLTLVSIKSQLS